jgi:hypothetical protein
MRQLHFVERDAGTVVLATSDGLERFELPVDETLRSALDDVPADAAATPAGTPSSPRITPREIQARVRAGEKAEDLAKSSDAPLNWIMRFAGPVLAERELVTGEARRAKARRSTTEGQVVVFGEAVDARFAAHGIDPGDVRWDALRRDGGQWIVAASWVGGQAEHTAEWGFQLATRTVAPLDDTAADLLSDRPIRPFVAPPAPALALAPPIVGDVASFPPMPNADTGPLPRGPEPVDEDVFDQAQFEQAQREHEPTPASAVLDPMDTPPLPMQVPGADESAADPHTPGEATPAETTRIPKVTNLGVAERAERRPRKARDEKPARPTVPSWDDILLGARRKRD